MSTFNGLVSEFPAIRIDFFRQHPNTQPPLACFLSHVHSDHLTGLEGLRSPFVYCSPATRKILLRLERYPVRMNYANGILEARQQTYRHLSKVLKPLPLETATVIELEPGNSIQVTLFDANHCPGAVMFLIEGSGKAVLYTGDIRSEPWFVNNLMRNPNIIEYTQGIKTLDKVYIDTTFIEDVAFQTKAEGLAELLRKVHRYPEDTIFHFRAWTYGYEDIWVALSKVLKSRIHVDDYKLRVYNSLRRQVSSADETVDTYFSHEAPTLTGFRCGNTPAVGCLTDDVNARLHSCEKGNMCEKARGPGVVNIVPIITYLPDGTEILEAGAGGGGDDLEREAELSAVSEVDMATIKQMVQQYIDHSGIQQEHWRTMLGHVDANGRPLPLTQDSTKPGTAPSVNVETLVEAVLSNIKANKKKNDEASDTPKADDPLPRTIHFAYSRHSSYAELCHFVEALNPKDVWPCTVDMEEWLHKNITIQSLFGRFCSGEVFAHDNWMRPMRSKWSQRHPTSPSLGVISSPIKENTNAPLISSPRTMEMPSSQVRAPATEDVSEAPFSENNATSHGAVGEKRCFSEFCNDGTGYLRVEASNSSALSKEDNSDGGDHNNSQRTDQSVTSALSITHRRTPRADAYYRILDNVEGDGEWQPITLLSTDGHHSVLEEEL